VTGRADRSSAYAELVSGLLEARHDAASARFDAEVAAAEADGRIDERTARVLRWWQRESVRAVVEHARSVIPPALGALDEADEEASRQNDDAAQAWERATARPLPQLGLQVLSLPDPASAEDPPAPAEPVRTAEFALDAIDESTTPVAPAGPAWAIPAAREAEVPTEEPARRLLVAGLNPVARLGGPTQRDPRTD
jgi:hypothetical protein